MTALSAATVLQWAMEIETNGEAFYKAVAAQSQDTDAKVLFDDLAYQEQRHRRTFQRMLEKVEPGASAGDAETGEYRQYLENALSHALFEGKQRGLELAKQAKTEEEAIKAAIAFEKDTLIFFYDLRDMVPESQHKAIDAVIDEEKDHVRQLGRALAASPWAM